jgi:hypothetical protein
MVYSPGIVLMRDDYGEWRSPVEVDVLTSAAVNAGEIRRELEREEKLRRERMELEYWKRRGEERRKAIAERLRVASMNRKKREERGMLKREQVIQEPTSSTIVHPLSPPTQPSQAPDPGPNLNYTLALESTEMQINRTMHCRISRILHLFQLQQTPNLILGSFGTGVFKNHIDVIATIFADLLIKPDGRFKDVFSLVVFAILGKETVRVFTQVFGKFDKQAQRAMRMMRWEASRRRKYTLMEEAAYAASFDPAQIDAASHPLSLDAAQDSVFSYPTSSAAAGAASYAPSFDAAQAYSASPSLYAASDPPSSDATRASAIFHPTFSTDAAIQANPTYVDYDGTPEDAKMILTRSDEQVDLVVEATNAPINPNVMVVEDGKDIEMTETDPINPNAVVVEDGKNIEITETESLLKKLFRRIRRPRANLSPS